MSFECPHCGEEVPDYYVEDGLCVDCRSAELVDTHSYRRREDYGPVPGGTHLNARRKPRTGHGQLNGSRPPLSDRLGEMPRGARPRW